MDDEIVIGVEKGVNKKAPNKKKKASKKSNNKKANPKKGKVRKQAKVLLGIIVFFVLLVLILCSPLFDIKNIQIEGNAELSKEKLISISSLQLHTNIFKFRKS